MTYSQDSEIVKGCAMVIMWCLIVIMGNVPLRVKSFKENQKVLAIASAFSGGLFISIGLIHILPEAGQDFNDYIGSDEHFPFQMLTVVLSFSFVLLIEKVIGAEAHHHHHHIQPDSEEKQTHIHIHNHNHDHDHDHNHDHHHNHHHHDTENNKCSNDKFEKELSIKNEKILEIDNKDCCKVDIELQNQQLVEQLQTQPIILCCKNTSSKEDSSPLDDGNKQSEDENKTKIKSIEEEGIRINSQHTPAIQNHNHEDKCSSEEEDNMSSRRQQNLKKVMEHTDAQLENAEENHVNPMTPFVLQIALGIHATLEGLAIGVEQDFSKCLTIALAVVVHKWAEGMVLGLALKQSKMKLSRATIMVMIQACMNPIGIGIGWALSDSGSLVSGILMSVSAGTFIYIATNEVIAEEFSKVRYQVAKFIFYLIGIGFICSLYFVEQATGA